MSYGQERQQSSRLVQAEIYTPKSFSVDQATNLALPPKSPEVINHAGIVFFNTGGPTEALYLPNTYVNRPSEASVVLDDEVNNITWLQAIGRNRFTRPIAAAAAVAIAVAGSALMQPTETAAQVTKAKAPHIDKIAKPGSGSWAKNSRQAQTASREAQASNRNCATLTLKDFPEISVKESNYDIAIVTFPEHQAGKQRFLNTPSLKTDIYRSLDALGPFAQRETGGTLTYNPNMTIVDMPGTMDSYRQAHDPNSTSNLLESIIAASPPRSYTEGQPYPGKLYIYLVNPDTPYDDYFTYPGFFATNRLYNYAAFVPLVVFEDVEPGWLETQQGTLAHEIYGHGVLAVIDHESDLINPNPNRYSVLWGSSQEFPFNLRVLTNFNLKDNRCATAQSPTTTPTRTPLGPTATPISGGYPIPTVKPGWTRQIYLPAASDQVGP